MIATTVSAKSAHVLEQYKIWRGLSASVLLLAGFLLQF